MQESQKGRYNLEQIRETDECAMHSFHNGTIKDICTTAVYSGCGKINASITAQLLIDRYDVDAIIFSGIAGGMRKEVKIFDTVVCTASSFHDTDNEIYTDFPVMKAPIFYADDGLTALAKEAAGRIGRKIHFGLRQQETDIWSRFIRTHCALIWKTAAVAHACYLNGVPFIAVRSISDNDKEAGQEAINRNYDKAVQWSYQFVSEMLERIR